MLEQISVPRSDFNGAINLANIEYLDESQPDPPLLPPLPTWIIRVATSCVLGANSGLGPAPNYLAGVDPPRRTHRCPGHQVREKVVAVSISGTVTPT